jgi:DNA polymerase elongation subunit (family B)
MYSREKFKKFLFFDIETCGQYPDFQSFIDDKGPGAGGIFEKKSSRLLNGKSWSGDLHEDYPRNVALFPEFGRIACLSYGVWKDGEMQVSSIYDNDEKELLKKAANLFWKAGANGLIPTGWNIKNFDVSWLVRRMLMNGIQVPDCLSSYEKKPWDMNIFDLKDFWKSGSSLDVTFEEAAFGMGIPSPKDDIDGSQVHKAFWSGQSERVKDYCEKDVKTMILLCEKIFQIYSPADLAYSK